MVKPYFSASDDQIPPLRHSVTRKVRFEEVDALGIVWHGRYASYFEDARAALGDRFGIGYLDFYTKGIFAPIKKMHIDYHIPLHFTEPFSIEAIL
ncbi:MAG: acyl-CoA thioesterase, partial [Thermodesulfobacteriota bacterium]